MLIDTLSRLLDGCLDREGQHMTDHQNKEYRVFFRMNKDKNLTIDHLSIYHRADSGIVPGLELRFVGGDQNTVLLVLNCENIEGAAYRRSDCVKCNEQYFQMAQTDPQSLRALLELNKAMFKQEDNALLKLLQNVPDDLDGGADE